MLSPKDILQILREHCDLPNPQNDDVRFTDDDFERCVTAPLADALEDEDWSYEYGATKLVLIFNELPFVIKIPFMGGHMSYSSWTNVLRTEVEGKSCSSITDSDYRETSVHRSYTSEFNCAVTDDFAPRWDYCALEVMIYGDARDAHLDKLFAEEAYLGDVNGYPIYIQAKAQDLRNSTTHTSSAAAYTAVRNIMSEVCGEYINHDWCANVVELYGEEKFKQLMTFIKAHDINDIHDGNVGYINDLPVLIDYSGYWE